MAKYNFPPGEVGESLANAISWISRQPVDKSQVVVEPYGNMAGQYLVTIYETPDIAKKVIPFIDKHGAIPIELGTLCPIGYKTNRKIHEFNPWQHGQIIGATESGKSSCLHCMLAHVTRCPQCFVWVGGVWKLYDFVSSWVEPYLDTGLQPPIERIAHGQEDVCRLIAAFLNVAAWRLNLRNSHRSGLPYGILILDEVTYVANNRLARVCYNGENLNASQLISGVARGTAGAKQYMWMTGQRDTQDNFGDDGGTTTAQMGFSFIFYIKDAGAVGRVTNDFGLDVPRSKGECWADFGMDGGIHKLRIPYPQADDPLKPVLHNGTKVSEIAWARRNIKHELDEGSARAADEYFPNRFPLVTNEFLDYLTTVRPVSTADDSGFTMPISPPGIAADLAAAEREYALMARESGQPAGNPDVAGTHSGDVTSIRDFKSEHGTRDNRVQTVVVANDLEERDPMTRGEIIEALQVRFGDHVKNPRVVSNILKRFVDVGVMARTEDDKYYSV